MAPRSTQPALPALLLLLALSILGTIPGPGSSLASPATRPLREHRDPHSGRPVVVPRAVPTFSEAPSATGGSAGAWRCGSYPERVLDELSEGAALRASGVVALPTSQSYDRGEIAVIEDDGTLLRTSGPNVSIDPAALSRRFLELHDDEYDYVCVLSASNMTNLSLGGGTAYELNVRNEVQGLGLSIYDFSEEYGSNGVIKSFLNMNRLSIYPNDPHLTFHGTNTALEVIAHEFDHRFGAYTFFNDGGNASPLLLGRDSQHWSFFHDTQASDMEGNRWRDNLNGTYTSIDATNGFSYLDEYLMGLRDSSEVDTVWYIHAPTNFNPPGAYERATSPAIGVTCSGLKRRIDISQIVSINGLRSPGPATSQKVFRMAWLLLIRNGDVPIPADLAKIDLFRTSFQTNFQGAVENLASVNTDLNSVPGNVVIEHTPLKDTENTAAARPVSAVMYVRQRSLLVGFDASSPRLFYRTNGGPYTALVMSPAGGDQYQAVIPAQAAGTIVDYYLTGASDSSGIDAGLPAGAPATAFRYHVGPDVTKPVLAHTPPPDPAVLQMPITVKVEAFDNLGLDSVSVEWRIDSGPWQTARVAAPGDGPYGFPIGAGAVFGDVVSYRFGAVDRASGRNRTILPAGTTSFALMVGNNYAEDFENSSGGYTHAAVAAPFIDEWHVSSQGNHTPGGGTSWKCGAAGTAPYAPKLDAALVSAPMSVGTGGMLSFWHFFDLEAAEEPGQAYDGGKVEISTNNGASWSSITPVGGYPASMIVGSDGPFPGGTGVYSGSSEGFVSATFSMAAFAGQTVRVRWRMGTDSFIGGEGWYVDDVTLTNPGGEPVSVPVAGAEFSLDAAIPNPTTRAARIGFRLPAPSAVSLTLYDVKGARIRTLIDGPSTAGPHQIEWDGKTDDGRVAAPGLYFYRLTTPTHGTKSGRLVLIPG